VNDKALAERVKLRKAFVRLLTCAALLAMLLCQFGCVSEPFDARVQSLSERNESFAEARRILGKPEINTPDEIRQAVDRLNNALEREQSGLDKSVIQTALAQIYLIVLRDCHEAKRHSSAAVSLDPDSARALEIDVSSDFCFAGATGDYDPIIERMEKLAEQGRYFRLLYSLMGNAYMIRSNQTNAQADLLKAKSAFLKARERGEPQASPNALGLSIEELERRLKRTQ